MLTSRDMPTNVTPEYKAAEARHRAARTDEERLAALEEMARTLNKHKGTEKLYADIKSRIKELRLAADHKAGHHGHSMHVAREGAAQVVLLGPPNGGKSSLLGALTHATPEIASYPFTTRAPLPGMAAFEDVRLQLVDLPPISTQHTEPWVFVLAHHADAALLVFDVTALDPAADIEATRALLAAHFVELCGRGQPAPEDFRVAGLPAILVGTHLDEPGAADILELVRDAYPAFEVIGVGAGGGAAEALPRAIFERLELVRAYAKPPGKEPDRSRPYVFRRGATVGDFAAQVHRDFAEHLAFARLWGHGKFEAQRVNRDYQLRDGDCIELHL
jgi:ribosome-interacting GTPase 1